MHKALGLLIALLLVLSGQAAVAQDFPKLTGRVVDQADLLDPQQEAALTAKLAGLETRTQRQLVVATLNSLEGYEISDYGYRLGREWALGQDGKGETEKDNGAILIIAPNERKMRIEVGYGLEPVLTDGLSSTIIRNDITPHFKDGDFVGGINAGVDRIVTQLELPADEAAKIASAAQASSINCPARRVLSSTPNKAGNVNLPRSESFPVRLPIDETSPRTSNKSSAIWNANPSFAP